LGTVDGRSGASPRVAGRASDVRAEEFVDLIEAVANVVRTHGEAGCRSGGAVLEVPGRVRVGALWVGEVWLAYAGVPVSRSRIC
jgi:hypothetical protein